MTRSECPVAGTGRSPLVFLPVGKLGIKDREAEGIDLINTTSVLIVGLNKNKYEGIIIINYINC